MQTRGNDADCYHGKLRHHDRRINREIRTSNSLPPARIVFTLEFHGDRAIRIDRLFTGPSNWLLHARTNLKFGGQAKLAAVTLWKQKGTLPDTAAMGMSCIECTL